MVQRDPPYHGQYFPGAIIATAPFCLAARIRTVKNRVYLRPRRSFRIAKLFASVTGLPQLDCENLTSKRVELLDNTLRIAEWPGRRNKTLRIRSNSARKFPYFIGRAVRKIKLAETLSGEFLKLESRLL